MHSDRRTTLLRRKSSARRGTVFSRIHQRRDLRRPNSACRIHPTALPFFPRSIGVKLSLVYQTHLRRHQAPRGCASFRGAFLSLPGSRAYGFLVSSGCAFFRHCEYFTLILSSRMDVVFFLLFRVHKRASQSLCLVIFPLQIPLLALQQSLHSIATDLPWHQADPAVYLFFVMDRDNIQRMASAWIRLSTIVLPLRSRPISMISRYPCRSRESPELNAEYAACLRRSLSRQRYGARLTSFRPVTLVAG